MPKKIGPAGLIARLILFVFFLGLPFLAAGTVNRPLGLLYLGLMPFLVGAAAC